MCWRWPSVASVACRSSVNNLKKGDFAVKITKAQADQLIANGLAEITGYTYDDGCRWAVVTRFGTQTVDHYCVECSEQPANAMT